MTEEQKILVEDNINFAYWLVNQWTARQKELDRDELESIALEALTKAAIKFNSSKGMNFINFAKMLINHSIIGEINKQKNYYNHCLSNTPDNEDFSHEDSTDSKIDLHKAIESLPKHYQEILKDYYFRDMDQAYIADKHDISVSSVSLILKQCRENMKDLLIK